MYEAHRPVQPAVRFVVFGDVCLRWRAMSDTPTVIRSEPVPGVQQLTLSRPDRLNALTYDLVSELYQAFEDIDRDHDCRVVVITGAGRGFCAGLDLTGFGEIPGTEGLGRPQRGLATQQYIADLVPTMRDLRQPVIAAINGAATGGGLAIALASDVRIASTVARFGTAFVRLGLSGCDIGTSWLLPRLIGAARSHELLLTGRVIEVEEANALGLLTKVVEPDELLPAALETAGLIARNSPFGVWMTKEVAWSNLEIGSLRAGIDLENRNQIMSSMTEDSAAAMRGFLAGEVPDWQNR